MGRYRVNKIGGGRVENVKRYTGWERLDNEWVDTGLIRLVVVEFHDERVILQ